MRAPAELPKFISGKDIIIASSYRRNLTDVRRASHEFSKLGLTVYPNHDQKKAVIDSDFVFMGGENINLAN